MARTLAAAEAERADVVPRICALRDRFAEAVLNTVPGARLTGHARRRLPGTASFVFTGTHGEAVLLELERRGIICSSGSACAAGSDEPCHVLTALGLPAELARTAVRFTFGAASTEREADQAPKAVRQSVDVVRGLRAAGRPSRWG